MQYSPDILKNIKNKSSKILRNNQKINKNKCKNVTWTLLKFNKQIKIQYRDLITFFVVYIGFDI